MTGSDRAGVNLPARFLALCRDANLTPELVLERLAHTLSEAVDVDPAEYDAARKWLCRAFWLPWIEIDPAPWARPAANDPDA